MSAYDDYEYNERELRDAGDNGEDAIIRANEWKRNQALVDQAQNGHGGALAQLRREQVRPIADAYKGRCPQSLSDRLYRTGCDVLDEWLNEARDQTDADEWARAVSRIKETVRKQYDDWARDRDLAAMSQRANSRLADDALLEKYSKRIEYVARKFREFCDEISDDLAQEGRILLYSKVIPTYDWRTGYTLWEYAAKAVWRRMRDVCLSWTKAQRKADPMRRLVLATFDNLRQELGREPTPQEVAEECGLEVEDVRSMLQRRESPDVASLDRWDGDDSDGAAVRQPGSWGNDPAALLSAQSLHDQIVRFLNEQSDDQDGVKWLTAFTLNNLEEYWWHEIVDVLSECKSVRWPDLHEHYQLPPSVPTNWHEICALFSNPPPKLTEESMKKWFGRRRTRLLEELSWSRN